MGWDELENLDGPSEGVSNRQAEIATYELPAEDKVKKNGLIIAVYGKEKVGKSIFAASASLCKKPVTAAIGSTIPPGTPMIFIDTELSANWLRKFYEAQFKTKDIRVFSVYKEHAKTKEIDPIASFEQFWNVIIESVTMKEGTIVIDSLSDIYQWVNSYLRLKILELDPSTSGFNSDIRPSSWYWRNDKWETLMKMLRKAQCNVIFTAKVKKVWAQEPSAKTGKPTLMQTSRYEPVWHQSTPYWADILMDLQIRYKNGAPIRTGIIKGARSGIEFDHEIEKPNFQKICNVVAAIKPELEW